MTREPRVRFATQAALAAYCTLRANSKGSDDCQGKASAAALAGNFSLLVW